MKYTVIIVLYNQKLDDSKTFQSLNKYVQKNKNILNSVNILIFDNSEMAINKVDGNEIFYDYIQAGENKGLAKAYNYALSKAQNCEWLILLDQDSDLTEEYFQSIFHLENLNNHVVAVVPQVISNGKIVSPILGNELPKMQKKLITQGVYFNLMAINSASAIRVSFLNEIGGFNEAFRLDYLDHWLYHEISQMKLGVYVLGTVINHELSVTKYNEISLNRYKSILNSEIIFQSEYSLIPIKKYKKRLVFRFFKQLLFIKNKRIAFYTLKKFKEIK